MGFGCSQGLPKIFRAPIHTAHRVVIFAIAQLSCSYLKFVVLERQKTHFCVIIWGLKSAETYCAHVQSQHTGVSLWVKGKMELAGENGRVDTTMSVSRVPSPTEMACQVAENWCYTQVLFTWRFSVRFIDFCKALCGWRGCSTRQQRLTENSSSTA